MPGAVNTVLCMALVHTCHNDVARKQWNGVVICHVSCVSCFNILRECAELQRAVKVVLKGLGLGEHLALTDHQEPTVALQNTLQAA